MSETMAALDNDDRRDFFRIDDNVVLTYRQVPQDQLPKALKTLGENLCDAFTLAATFDGLTQQNRALHQRVYLESAAVAQYLDALERKLDMLARVLMLREMGVDEKQTRRVNLSAGGMEFHTGDPLSPGAILEMKFVVFPSRIGILAGGEVIRCDADPEYDDTHPYKVAVKFRHLRESDRQLLIKHVLGKQASQLRREHGHAAADDDGDEHQVEM